MKISGGKYKGRNFYMPAGIRPTQEVTRKAIFDIIGHDLEEFSFLELFSGSGAVGLEAFSRGAGPVVLVEKDPKTFDTLTENVNLVTGNDADNDETGCQLVNSDAFVSIKMFARRESKFDIVFVDPPYGRGLAKKALKTLEACDILHPTCTVIVQNEKEETLPKEEGRLQLKKQKKYGSSIISIYNIKDNE